MDGVSVVVVVLDSLLVEVVVWLVSLVEVLETVVLVGDEVVSEEVVFVTSIHENGLSIGRSSVSHAQTSQSVPIRASVLVQLAARQQPTMGASTGSEQTHWLLLRAQPALWSG